MRSHQVPCPAIPSYWGGIWKQWQICSEDCVWGRGLFSSVWVSVFLIWKVWMTSPSLSESRRIVQFKWARGGDSTWWGDLSIMNCAYCSCSSLGCDHLQLALPTALHFGKMKKTISFTERHSELSCHCWGWLCNRKHFFLYQGRQWFFTSYFKSRSNKVPSWLANTMFPELSTVTEPPTVLRSSAREGTDCRCYW